jgi:hypothetical protein
VGEGTFSEELEQGSGFSDGRRAGECLHEFAFLRVRGDVVMVVGMGAFLWKYGCVRETHTGAIGGEACSGSERA